MGDNSADKPVPLSDLPAFWDDTRLLDYDPFLTSFCKRAVRDEEGYGTRGLKKQNDTSIYREMWDDKGDMEDAYVYWTKIAFREVSPRKSTGMKAISKVKELTRSDVYNGDGVIWMAFIDIFWKLHKQQTKDAQLLMRSVRSDRGHSVDLPNEYVPRRDRFIGRNERIEAGLIPRPSICSEVPHEESLGVESTSMGGSTPRSCVIANGPHANDRPAKKRKKEKSLLRSGTTDGNQDCQPSRQNHSSKLVSDIKMKGPKESKKSDKVGKQSRKNLISNFDNDNGDPQAVSRIDKNQATQRYRPIKMKTGSVSDDCQSPVDSEVGSVIVTDHSRWKNNTQAFFQKEKTNIEPPLNEGVTQSNIGYNNSKSYLSNLKFKKRSLVNETTTGVPSPFVSSVSASFTEHRTQQISTDKRKCNSDDENDTETRNRPKHLQSACDYVNGPCVQGQWDGVGLPGAGRSGLQQNQYVQGSRVVASHSFFDSASGRQTSNVNYTYLHRCIASHVPRAVPSIIPQSRATTIKTVAEKPTLPNNLRPRIWAASRQALCETATWFRAYQSGVYFTKGIASGYLLGSFSSQRDIWHHNGKLIISHGGGGSKIYSNDSGKHVVALDQDDRDYSVQALIKKYEEGSPIVLIADDTYKWFPYDLGKYTYVILGYYRIINVWAETEQSLNDQGRCIKYKFAFQWCEGQETPWWISQPEANNLTRNGVYISPDTVFQGGSPEEEEVESGREDAWISTDAIRTCDTCHKSSPTVFREGWACLQPRCGRFWKAEGQAAPAFETLNVSYRSEFLSLRSPPPISFGEEKLRPYHPNQLKPNSKRRGPSIRGWWCPGCGQLCCRENWEFWVCSECNISQPDLGVSTLISPKDFWGQNRSLASRNYLMVKGSAIEHRTWRWSEGSVSGPIDTFILPENRGKIHLILGQQHGNCNGRADEIFQDYQKEAEKGNFLKRYPLRSHKCRGRLLANYFSQNSGVPYKYVAGTDGTVPFDRAPEVVRNALQLIKDRVAKVLQEGVDFNEILTAAYMEEQSMSYHTDSEEGLGPVVSSLSLGSAAWMHFRLRSLKNGSDRPRHRELSLLLRHGDVLVMDGAEIQDVYEHTVEPQGLRIAATARVIGESNFDTYTTPLRKDRK